MNARHLPSVISLLSVSLNRHMSHQFWMTGGAKVVNGRNGCDKINWYKIVWYSIAFLKRVIRDNQRSACDVVPQRSGSVPSRIPLYHHLRPFVRWRRYLIWRTSESDMKMGIYGDHANSSPPTACHIHWEPSSVSEIHVRYWTSWILLLLMDGWIDSFCSNTGART